LGALAGLLFEIGSNRMIIEENAMNFIKNEIEKFDKAKKTAKERCRNCALISFSLLSGVHEVKLARTTLNW